MGRARRVFGERGCPLWVTMELAEQKRNGTRLLHLLNFRIEEPLTNIPVKVRLPRGRRLRAAVLESPDGQPRQVLEVSAREGVVSLVVPKLEIYNLILLRTFADGDGKQGGS